MVDRVQQAIEFVEGLPDTRTSYKPKDLYVFGREGGDTLVIDAQDAHGVGDEVEGINVVLNRGKAHELTTHRPHCRKSLRPQEQGERPTVKLGDNSVVMTDISEHLLIAQAIGGG